MWTRLDYVDEMYIFAVQSRRHLTVRPHDTAFKCIL